MTPTEVLTSFYQDGKNNCATIGIIKTAISHFGKDRVFKSITHDSVGANYTVVMQDDSVVQMNEAEHVRISKQSGFTLNPDANHKVAKEITEFAGFCFSVVVKHLMQIDRINEKDSLYEINGSGINSDYAYRNLGIPESKIKFLTTGNKGTLDARDYKNNAVYLLYNNNHCVMAVLDKYDEYSDPTDVSLFAAKHSGVFKPGKRCWGYKFE